MAEREQMTEEQRETWRKVLTEGHPSITILHRLFRYLPGPPRCKVCHNPFGGIGGKIVGLLGFRPSRKNPLVCAF
jgi:adenylate cyclase